jgi:hypothetical protein
MIDETRPVPRPDQCEQSLWGVRILRSPDDLEWRGELAHWKVARPINRNVVREGAIFRRMEVLSGIPRRLCLRSHRRLDFWDGEDLQVRITTPLSTRARSGEATKASHSDTGMSGRG